MVRQVLRAMAWTAVAVVLAGCQDEPEAIQTGAGVPRQVGPTTELVAMARPPIADVPVPTGFELEAGRSRSVAEHGVRWVDHSYLGTSSRYAVSRFYRRQMPVNRWELVSDRFRQGTVYLDFRRDTETCRIVIGDGTWLKGTRIQATILPSGQSPAEARHAQPPEN